MVCTRPAGAAECGHWLGGPDAAHWLCAIPSVGLCAMGLWHMTSDEVFLTVSPLVEFSIGECEVRAYISIVYAKYFSNVR